MNTDIIHLPRVSSPEEFVAPDKLDCSRILIIDDTQGIHDDFIRILGRPRNSSLDKARAELFGLPVDFKSPVIFELASAFQGNEAPAMVEQALAAGRPYSLAFVDVRMPPGWDGVETAARLWKIDPDLQIVICTAYSDQTWQAVIERLGNSDSLLILKKPFDPVEILQLAHALTKKWLLSRQNKWRVAELEAGVAARTAELRATNQRLLEEINETKRAQAQVNLQLTALSAAANAILITDADGKIEWVNPAFSELTGYSAAEVIGLTPRLFKSGQHPPLFYSQMWGTIRSGIVWRGEMTDKRKDGRLYTHEMTITPVRGTDGRIVHFVAIKQDVTEKRQIENRLQQAQKMEAIGTLAGGIAHDFNNMLATIFGYSNMLQLEIAGNAAAAADVEEILKAANRAKDLVQQILTFSHKREEKRQAIQLDAVVKEAMKFLRASLPAQIKIETHFAPETPTVLADSTQIYQATVNLGTNAFHAMEGRAGLLTVRLDSFLPDPAFLHANSSCRLVPHARITVADTGHGMSEKTLERIFEPFFTTKPVGKGTGLGLAVVHGIMNSHEGVITVESEVGRGTKFQLLFPAHTLKAKPVPTEAVKLPRGAGETILLVDDEQSLIDVLQRALKNLNYRVVTSPHGRDALRLFQLNPAQYHLVVTDLMMPEMNGLELARQLRALRLDLPIILASGHAAGLNQDDLEAAGFCELLEKPFSIPTLACAVQRALADRASSASRGQRA